MAWAEKRRRFSAAQVASMETAKLGLSLAALARLHPHEQGNRSEPDPEAEPEPPEPPEPLQPEVKPDGGPEPEPESPLPQDGACPVDFTQVVDVDDVAAATIEKLNEVQFQARPLDKFAPEVLQTFLDGASWTRAMDVFCTTNSPRFREFEVGMEYSIIMARIHNQFVSSAEALLDEQLTRMALSPERFIELLLADATGDMTERADTVASAVAQSVLATLEEFRDFQRFGAMMRARYEEIYAQEDVHEDNADKQQHASLVLQRDRAKGYTGTHVVVEGRSAPVGNDDAIHTIADDSGFDSGTGRKLLALGEKRWTHVRVLWDVESVMLPHGHKPYSVVQALQRSLQQMVGFDSSADVLITAFYRHAGNSDDDVHNRAGTGIPREVTVGMEEAGVTQVLCSADESRNDVVHRLIERFTFDVDMLPFASTALVLLSCDVDFSAALQQAQLAGFTTGVIHNGLVVEHVRQRDAEVLASHAAFQLAWPDVLALDPGPAESFFEGIFAQKDRTAAESVELQRRRRIQRLEGGDEIWSIGATHTGEVSYWHRSGGWGKIVRVDFASNHRWPAEIFVHNTSLPLESPQRWLEVGEPVLFTVKPGAMGRGPQAKHVRGVDPVDGLTLRPLRCQVRPGATHKHRGPGNAGQRRRRSERAVVGSVPFAHP